MENAEVARVLSEVADLLELTGGNQFKVRAYRQAAQVVDLLPMPVSELWRKGELTSLPGVGQRIAEHVGELLDTGKFSEHDRLASQVPPGVLELLSVEGVGPKTVAAAWKQLQVKDLDALEQVCRNGKLEKLPRMGAKRVEAIHKAIARYRARKGRSPLHRALPYAQALTARLRQVRGVTEAAAAGSLRRRRETVGDIDLLVAATDAEPVMRELARAPEVAQVLATGPTKCTVRLRIGLQADLRVLPPESFGAALHYFTGSKAHNIAVRSRAVRLGIKLSEYGVFDREGHRLGGASEEEVFRAVGLPWIPPELREGTGEIEAAEHGRLPALIEEKDVLGDLHVHSKASSDGRSEVAELAEEARRLGRRYLAITDHSRSRPLGLDGAKLSEHAAKIRGMDKRLAGKPHLLAGVEVDILPDGSLDLPAEVLSRLDLVVASVHSHFSDAPERMTERIVKALRTKVVHVLGHPSGRQLGVRDPYEFDLDRVLEVAREEGVAIEVNAMPERMDLSDKGCRLAKERDVQLAISSDAHNAQHLGNLSFGVWVARRGWLEKEDVLNALGFTELRRRIGRRRAAI
ncbi:MAG: DNA polymerase/3'-5' exonuclease PolX [Myxococcales bacterium]|nr:DNA polymerase/3'-5' exonuclease PolX [Myxococcales bacterium]